MIRRRKIKSLKESLYKKDLQIRLLQRKVEELDNALKYDKFGCYSNYMFDTTLNNYFRSVENLSKDYKGIIYIDVNNLKIVNDTEGHLAGNRLLSSIVDTLREAFENVFRIGGDEFLILVKHEESIPKRMRLDKRFSYGYAKFTKSEIDKEINWFINKSEQAMYKRKNK